MSYYYTQKGIVAAATSEEALAAITWDFTTFDATDPNISLQALMA
jgi:hypothetical protein